MNLDHGGLASTPDIDGDAVAPVGPIPTGAGSTRTRFAAVDPPGGAGDRVRTLRCVGNSV